MATTKLSYPKKLEQFPYASYLEISKYEYNEGLKKAYDSKQKDVASTLGSNSGIVGLINGISNGIAYAYNSSQFQRTVTTTATPSTRTGTPGSTALPVGATNGADPTQIAAAEDLLAQQLFEPGKTTVKETPWAPTEAVSDISNIILPIPNEFQSSYGADWSNEFKLGTLALLFEDPGAFAGAAAATGAAAGAQAGILGGVQALGTALLNKLPNGGVNSPIGQILGGAGNAAVAGAFNPFGINSPIGFQAGQQLTNLLGLAGLAPNENAIQFFKKMKFREFEFTFDMLANNKDEQKEIDQIIRTFKVAMHPKATLKGTGAILGFPSVFKIVPKFVSVDGTGKSKSIRHPSLPETKLCALVDFSINYAPMNNFLTTESGTIPYATMRCRFNEITSLTRADFAAGEEY